MLFSKKVHFWLMKKLKSFIKKNELNCLMEYCTNEDSKVELQKYLCIIDISCEDPQCTNSEKKKDFVERRSFSKSTKK